MTAAPTIGARLLRVTGVVQGVGFRPFVYRLAARHALTGWVRNVAGTVEIHVEGGAEELEAFQQELRTEAPPVARIDALELAVAVPTGAHDFRIIASADAEGIRPVTPDLVRPTGNRLHGGAGAQDLRHALRGRGGEVGRRQTGYQVVTLRSPAKSGQTPT